MPISMMKKLDCGKVNQGQMTLTLAAWSIAYPYGVLKDVLVKVDDLLFPPYFVTLDMEEDEKDL